MIPIPFVTHRDWYLVTREFQDEFMDAVINGKLPRFLRKHGDVLEKIAKKLKQVNIDKMPRSAYLCQNFLDLLNEIHTPRMNVPSDTDEFHLLRDIRNLKTRKDWQKFLFWYEFDIDQIIKHAFLQKVLGFMIEGDYGRRYFFLRDIRSDMHRIEHSYKQRKLVKI